MYKLFTADDFANDYKVQRNALLRMKMLDGLIKFPSLGGSQYATTRQVADFYRISTDEVKAWNKRAKKAFKIAGVEKMTGKEIMASVKFNGTIIVEKVKGGLVINDVPVVYSSNLLFSHNAMMLIGVFSTDSIVAERMRNALMNVESINRMVVDTLHEAYVNFKETYDYNSFINYRDKAFSISDKITAELTA